MHLFFYLNYIYNIYKIFCTVFTKSNFKPMQTALKAGLGICLSKKMTEKIAEKLK